MSKKHDAYSRRSVVAGMGGLGSLAASQAAAQQAARNAPISPKDNLKITRLETLLVKPRWLFLKVHPMPVSSDLASRFSRAAPSPARRR